MMARVNNRRVWLGTDWEKLEQVFEDVFEFNYDGIVWGQEDSEFGIAFKCTIEQPPSSEGKTIFIRVPPGMIVPMMKELRDQAVRMRSKTLDQTATSEQTV